MLYPQAFQIAQTDHPLPTLATAKAHPNWAALDSFPYPIAAPDSHWIRLDLRGLKGTYVLDLGHIPQGTLWLCDSGGCQEELFGVLHARKDKALWLLDGIHDPDLGMSRQRLLSLHDSGPSLLFLHLTHTHHFPFSLDIQLAPIETWRFAQQQARGYQDVWQGLFQGALLTLVMYHLLIFLIYRDRSFSTYVIYLLSIAFTFWDHFPAGRAALFDRIPWAGKVFLESMDVLSAMMFFWFMRSFIRLNQINLRWDRITLLLLWLALGAWGITYAIYAFTLNFYLKAGMISLAVPAMVGCIWLVFKLSSSTDTLVRYALAGGTVMIFSTLGNTLVVTAAWLGWIEVETTTRIYLTEICVLVQAFIFAMGLGYRLRKTETESHHLATLDRLKSNFFANVSHEFRTPLTLIMGPAQNMMEQSAEESQRHQAGLILRSAQRLLHLINQILDLAKLESGKLSLNLQAGDWRPFLDQLVHGFQAAAATEQIELTLAGPPTPCISQFDPEKVEQILSNLLSNALKFTPRGGKVTLRVEVQRERLAFSVTDTGVGIHEAHLPHIFDRFYQGSQEDYTTDQPSTGIGLALTRELVELHGGGISVQSTPGEGSVFSCWIPFIPAEEAVIQTTPIPQQGVQPTMLPELPAKTPIIPPPQAARILVIEDHPEVRSYLRQILHPRYEWIEATDGAEGMKAAQQHVPDLIITDVMMPKVDGFDVTKTLKEQAATSHIPIIILTGKSSRESKLEGLSTYADAYLTKPFDAAELLVRIEGLLENRRKLQARYSKQLLLDETALELVDPEAQWLDKAIAHTTQHMSEEQFSVEQLADLMALDRSQLYRKLKALTGQNPSQFINTCRLRQARHLISTSQLSLAEIAYYVGFSSPAYFSRVFKEKYGLSPTSFRSHKQSPPQD